MFNFIEKFKLKPKKKCSSNSVANTIVLEEYKKEASDCMVYITEILQPTILECHSIADNPKAKQCRKEIAEKIEEALIPFYSKLKTTIDSMMIYSFNYDLGYLEPNLKEYEDAETMGKKGIILPYRMYQSLDSLHQMYSRVNTPGALKADIKARLNKAYIETRVVNQILAALVVNIGTKQRELNCKGK